MLAYWPQPLIEWMAYGLIRGEGVDSLDGKEKEDGSDSLESVGEDGGLGLGDGFVPSFVDAGGLGSASG